MPIKRGNKELQIYLNNIEDYVVDKVKQIVLDTTLLLHSEAVANCPTDQGALKNSIEWSLSDDGLTGTVLVGQEYAVYVEFGTGIYATGPGGSKAKKIPWTYFNERYDRWITTEGMRAQPFWFPAVDSAFDYFEKEMSSL